MATDLVWKFNAAIPNDWICELDHVSVRDRGL